MKIPCTKEPYTSVRELLDDPGHVATIQARYNKLFNVSCINFFKKYERVHGRQLMSNASSLKFHSFTHSKRNQESILMILLKIVSGVYCTLNGKQGH